MARIWLAMTVLLLGIAAPARADDISATARGVVRVVTIASVDGQVVGFGHGSGVAVAPNRVITNAHVVELAQRYPDDVVIGVVPSEGAKSYQGHVVAYDGQRDLALVEFTGGTLPPAALYTGPASEGDAVVALGYPGNVDLATARSAADYILPTSPIRSQGVFSGRRSLSGTDVLLHTASIARGNSGGPLLDRCGRVLGINSAITHGEDGDSSFGFAIADSEVAAFLRAANQPYVAAAAPCTSIEERLRADSDADARAAADAAQARRQAATDAQIRQEEALAAARGEAERARENVMALAALLLVGGALAIGAAGLLASRGRRGPAIWTGAGGVAAVIASVVVFVFRPSPDVAVPAATRGLATPAVSDAALGKLSCTLVPERSRLVVSSAASVPLDWGRDGCVNGRTQYLPGEHHWERVLVPDHEQTVSVLGFDPATRSYAVTRYFLSAAAMDAARKLRGPVAGSCTADPAARAAQTERAAAIRAELPPLPNEKLVYDCRSASGGG